MIYLARWTGWGLDEILSMDGAEFWLWLREAGEVNRRETELAMRARGGMF